MLRPFHVAFPVQDLVQTRHFYEEILGCRVGRTSDTWIDFDVFGHQLTAHLSPKDTQSPSANAVDGRSVPVRHWGVILDMETWQSFRDRLQAHGITFVIEPYIRFQGEVGEQATLFFLDPSGNALEFKAFQDDAAIFATEG
ncbi:VOC family protein [Leptolyngbya sp. CCY15150]|uniref:VOC family protein n=1 Tax=Leptolyngbya sp. CCY15150 TaxID=2767772 RepID=UPI001951F598|nr:VOC family protein [Leptolyngbya sp. CCY15150]